MKINWRATEIYFDDEDKDIVLPYSWCIQKAGYVVSRICGKVVYMHRHILKPRSGFDVDHINGIKTDNRRSNLRECSRHQNLSNQRKKDNSTSNYKGVTYFKRDCVWVSQVTSKYKNIYIGRFPTEKEAAIAYDKMAKELHGEYARTNF